MADHIHGNFVELSNRQIGEIPPIGASVKRLIQATITANEHVVGIIREDRSNKILEIAEPFGVVAAIIPSAGIQRTDEVKAFFNEYRNKKDKAKDVIALSLERLEINLRMRKTQ